MMTSSFTTLSKNISEQVDRSVSNKLGEFRKDHIEEIDYKIQLSKFLNKK